MFGRTLQSQPAFEKPREDLSEDLQYCSMWNYRVALNKADVDCSVWRAWNF
jgi:hypothetical protein